MWPLSRKNYPKQFMKIRGDQSMFQETIARNMAYCDEFYIVAGREYQFIIEGQMQAFQGIQYRLFLEEEPWKTTAAIVLPSMLCSFSELIFVVASDQMIEGGGYKDSVLKAKELAREGYLVTIGIPVTAPETRFGYLHIEEDGALQFIEKPEKEQAAGFYEADGYWWNGGMFLFGAGDMLQELKQQAPEIYAPLRRAAARLKKDRYCTDITKELLQETPRLAIEKALFEKTGNIKMVAGDFLWKDIGSLEDLEALQEVHETLNTKRQDNEVLYECENMTVINQAERQLIVANQCRDLMVVNTEDAIYIGKKGASDGLKAIIHDNPRYKQYFEENRIAYRSWGTRQVLSEAPGYRVKKVILFPGKTIYTHRHEYRSEHWSIVSGRGRITLDGKACDYEANESIYVPIGKNHQVSNIGEEELIIIEVAVGRIVGESDMITEPVPDIRETELGFLVEEFVFLKPAYKDYLWGGTKLREQFGKKCDYEIIAECWELSAHEDGQSKVFTGRHRGMLFGEYLNHIGRKHWGWKCQAFERFPIMIKLIDAREQLSIQVHPDDDYALEQENEYGKNEVWYIMDCEEEAGIYCGFNRDMTPGEVRERIAEGTILEVLNWIPVKPGDVFYISAGTVHAIGAGVMICEIQQSSNCTYRLYDYGRKDKYGSERPLHLEQALQVADFSALDISTIRPDDESLLCSCKYFESSRLQVEGREELEIGEASFVSLVCIEGEGVLEGVCTQARLRKGDSVFVPARKNRLIITGRCCLIVTYV